MDRCENDCRDDRYTTSTTRPTGQNRISDTVHVGNIRHLVTSQDVAESQFPVQATSGIWLVVDMAV